MVVRVAELQWLSELLICRSLGLFESSFMRLIRAIDCPGYDAFSSQTNIPTSLTDFDRFCLQLWQGVVEQRSGRFCPADALMDTSVYTTGLRLSFTLQTRKLAFPKPQYQTTHQMYSIKHHQTSPKMSRWTLKSGSHINSQWRQFSIMASASVRLAFRLDITPDFVAKGLA